MRVHVLSDLHCEFGGFGPPALEADVTLLAGDTYTRGACFRLSLTGGEDPKAALNKVRRLADICVEDRHRARINDFHAIRVAADAYRRFRPKDAAQLHEQSVRWLRARLSAGHSSAA